METHTEKIPLQLMIRTRKDIQCVQQIRQMMRNIFLCILYYKNENCMKNV